jgi:hypothetical protein
LNDPFSNRPVFTRQGDARSPSPQHPFTKSILSTGLSMIRSSLLAAIALCAATASHSATVTAEISTFAGNGGLQPTDASYADDIEVRESPERAAAVGAASNSGEFGSARSLAEASADATLGELKLRVYAERNGPRIGGSSSISQAYAEIRQDFLVSGTGFISANLLLDVEWEGAQLNQSDARTFFGRSPSGGFDTAANFVVTGLDQPRGQVRNRMISASAFVLGAQDNLATIVWSLRAYTSAC